MVLTAVLVGTVSPSLSALNRRVRLPHQPAATDANVVRVGCAFAVLMAMSTAKG